MLAIEMETSPFETLCRYPSAAALTPDGTLREETKRSIFDIVTEDRTGLFTTYNRHFLNTGKIDEKDERFADFEDHYTEDLRRYGKEFFGDNRLTDDDLPLCALLRRGNINDLLGYVRQIIDYTNENSHQIATAGTKERLEDLTTLEAYLVDAALERQLALIKQFKQSGHRIISPATTVEGLRKPIQIEQKFSDEFAALAGEILGFDPTKSIHATLKNKWKNTPGNLEEIFAEYVKAKLHGTPPDPSSLKDGIEFITPADDHIPYAQRKRRTVLDQLSTLLTSTTNPACTKS